MSSLTGDFAFACIVWNTGNVDLSGRICRHEECLLTEEPFNVANNIRRRIHQRLGRLNQNRRMLDLVLRLRLLKNLHLLVVAIRLRKAALAEDAFDNFGVRKQTRKISAALLQKLGDSLLLIERFGGQSIQIVEKTIEFGLRSGVWFNVRVLGLVGR